MPIDYLEVILKTASRCNINCSYCYYYHGADEGWKSRSKQLTSSTLVSTAHFLKQAVLSHDIPKIQIDFHGGEPLLQSKKAFIETCQTFKEYLSPLTELRFALQTNAMLIDDGWIDIFERYGVHVSVSLDGPKTVNDQFRVDHNNRGTFDRAVKGIHQLVSASHEGRLSRIALLSVINPWAQGEEVFNFIVDELGIYDMDFLLPTKTHEPVRSWEVTQIGSFLLSAWHAWIKKDDPNIKIRIFNALFASLGGFKGFIYPANTLHEKKHFALTIDTDGTISGDDSLRSNPIWAQWAKSHVETATFDEFINSEKAWYAKHVKVPDACQNCLWEHVCQGGQLEHRYMPSNGYNNPSIYCEALQKMYEEVVSYLYQNGLSEEQLQRALVA